MSQWFWRGGKQEHHDLWQSCNALDLFDQYDVGFIPTRIATFQRGNRNCIFIDECYFRTSSSERASSKSKHHASTVMTVLYLSSRLAARLSSLAHMSTWQKNILAPGYPHWVVSCQVFRKRKGSSARASRSTRKWSDNNTIFY